MTLILAPGLARAGGPPQAGFVETFETFAYADGARTTAFWDRAQGVLTLRPPDAGHTRRWPALAAMPDGGMVVAWVEDRGAGPQMRAQRLDGRGNRLWAEDAALIAWAGDGSGLETGAHPLALAHLPGGELRLLWRDGDGVWTGVWDEGAGWVSAPMRLADTVGAGVSLRCLQADCALIWQEEGQSQLRLLHEGESRSLALPGAAHAAWRGPGDLWVVNVGGETGGIQRYDLRLQPRWQPPRGGPGDAWGLADIADLDGDLALLYSNPLAVVRFAGGDAASGGQVAAALGQEVAAAARWAALPGRLAMVWQTPPPASLYMRWLDGVSPLPEGRLLRLGLPGLEPILGDIVSTAEGTFAMAWTEGEQVFARKWTPSGWSPWRHEVAPGYAAAPGWVAAEGLGHSLAANPPWQGVTAVVLEAEVDLNGGSVQFFASNQGPTAWQPVEPGQRLDFAGAGTELRWYARLRRSPWGAAPVVHELRLAYEYTWMQHWPRVQVED